MKKRLKILSITILISLVLALATHIFIKIRIKSILKYTVTNISEGSLKLELGKANFSYFPIGITITDLALIPTKKTAEKTEITCDSLDLKIKSIFNIIFKKKLEVLTLTAVNPGITTYASDNSTTSGKPLAASLNEVQAKLLSALSTFKVKDANIINASVFIKLGKDTADYFSTNHINLELTDLVLEEDEKNQIIKQINKGNIALNNPNIHFPNNTFSIELGHLNANFNKNELKIDSLYLDYNDGKTFNQQVNFKQIEVINFDWTNYLLNGQLEMDSLKVAKGEIAINLKDEGLFQKDKKDTAQNNKSGKVIPINIHHIAISDVIYDLQLDGYLSGNKTVALTHIDGKKLTIKNLTLNPGNTPALKVSNLDVQLTNFTENDLENTYAISLDGVAINENTLVLKNYLIKAKEANKRSTSNFLSIPALILEDYSLEQLFLKKLVAKKIIVANPIIVLDLLSKNTKPNASESINTKIKKNIQSLKGKVNLESVVIDNASINLLPQSNPSEEYKISGLSMELDVAKAMQSGSIMDLVRSLTKLNSTRFKINSKDLNLVLSHVKLLDDNQGIYVGNLKGKINSETQVDLNGVVIKDVEKTLDLATTNGLHISHLMAESGTITINATGKINGSKTGKSTQTFQSFKVDNLILNNVALKLDNDSAGMSAQNINILGDSVTFIDNNLWWKSLAIQSKSNQLQFGTVQFSAGNLKLIQPGSFLINNSTITSKTDNATISFKAEKLLAHFGINNTNINNLKINKLDIYNPIINITTLKTALKNSTTNNTKNQLESFKLDTLILNNPTINYSSSDTNGTISEALKTIAGNLQLYNLSLSKNNGEPTLNIASGNYHTNQIEATFKNQFLNPSSIDVDFEKLNIIPSIKQFKVLLTKFKVGKLAHTIYGDAEDTLNLAIESVTLQDVQVNSEESIALKELLKTQKWNASGGQILYNTKDFTYSLLNISMQKKAELELHFDSLNVSNRLDRDVFWNNQPFETDYINFDAGKSNMLLTDFDFIDGTPIAKIKQVNLHNLFLTAERDKTQTADTVTFRPLIANQIKSLKIPVDIAEINLHNSVVSYHEISPKTQQEGRIYFTKINATIENIKTSNFTPTDSITIQATASLYDTGNVQFNFRQSYTDTAQGFKMKMRLVGFNMALMNGLLPPLIGISAKSGIIDTMKYRAIGNNQYSFGKINIDYHDLHIRLLSKGRSKYFLSGFYNWLIDLILRNKSNGKEKSFYKNRIKERGIFNYWAKISLQSFLSGIGINLNRKEQKQLKKEIENDPILKDFFK